MTLDDYKAREFYDSGKLYAKLSGSPYEIGFQHGQVAEKLIRRCIEVYSKLYAEEKNVTWALARERAEKYEIAIKTKYPEIWEELNGIAKGSNLDFLDILALNVRSEITLIDIADGCTSIAQRNRTTGEIFVGQNWDWIPEIDQATLFLEIHQEGKPKIIILAEAGIIGKYGFNSEGVAVMLNAIPSTKVDPSGLPVHFALRKALEQNSVDDSLKYLQQNPVASAANFLMADPGKYLTVEVSPIGNKIIGPEEQSGAVLHTNHFLDKELDEKIGSAAAILSSYPRMERVKDLSVPDLEASYESIRYRLSDLDNSPQSICHLPDGGKGLAGAITLYTIIINTQKKEGIITLGPPCDQTLPKYKLFFE